MQRNESGFGILERFFQILVLLQRLFCDRRIAPSFAQGIDGRQGCSSAGGIPAHRDGAEFDAGNRSIQTFPVNAHGHAGPFADGCKKARNFLEFILGQEVVKVLSDDLFEAFGAHEFKAGAIDGKKGAVRRDHGNAHRHCFDYLAQTFFPRF